MHPAHDSYCIYQRCRVRAVILGFQNPNPKQKRGGLPPFLFVFVVFVFLYFCILGGCGMVWDGVGCLYFCVFFVCFQSSHASRTVLATEAAKDAVEDVVDEEEDTGMGIVYGVDGAGHTFSVGGTRVAGCCRTRAAQRCCCRRSISRNLCSLASYRAFSHGRIPRLRTPTVWIIAEVIPSTGITCSLGPSRLFAKKAVLLDTADARVPPHTQPLIPLVSVSSDIMSEYFEACLLIMFINCSIYVLGVHTFLPRAQKKAFNFTSFSAIFVFCTNKQISTKQVRSYTHIEPCRYGR